MLAKNVLSYLQTINAINYVENKFFEASAQ
jgi:hypothetical protein